MSYGARILLNVIHNAVKSAPIKARCYQCRHMQAVPGNTHIACARPCDVVRGHPHGIANAWFLYPLLYDPTWMTVDCTTFEAR